MHRFLEGGIGERAPKEQLALTRILDSEIKEQCAAAESAMKGAELSFLIARRCQLAAFANLLRCGLLEDMECTATVQQLREDTDGEIGRLSREVEEIDKRAVPETSSVGFLDVAEGRATLAERLSGGNADPEWQGKQPSTLLDRLGPRGDA